MNSIRDWIPRQHGAWAMLIVPFVTGAVLRARSADQAAWLAPMGGAILTGYFGFDILTRWLHARPDRRSRYRRQLIGYASATVLLLALVLALGGWRLLGWLVPGIPFGALAVRLSARRRDRSLASGFATVAMAVGFGLAVRFPSPVELIRAWPTAGRDAIVFGALFGYFFGTVLHVKALIRERGQPAARRRTLFGHLILTGLAVVAALAGLAANWWIGFFVLATARTWWLTRPALVGRLRPSRIGMVEIVLSLLALIIAIC